MFHNLNLRSVVFSFLISFAATHTISNDPSNPPQHDSSTIGKHCTSYSSQDGCLNYPIPNSIGQLPLCGKNLTNAASIFGIIGDFGMKTNCAIVTAKLFQNVEKQLTGERGFDFVLSLGDNAYWSGLCEEYSAIAEKYYGRFFPKINYCSDNTDEVILPYQIPINDKPYGGLPSDIRFFPTIGNHDWDEFVERGSNMTSFPYFQFWNYLQKLPPTSISSNSKINGHYYNYKPHPNIEIFSLNSNYLSNSKWSTEWKNEHEAMMIWLKNALSESIAQFKIVFFHHPFISTAQHDSLADYMRYPYREWGASIVLNGHQHAMERILFKYSANSNEPIPVIVNGLGGHSWRYAIENCDPVNGSQKRYNGGHGFMVGIMHRDEAKPINQESNSEIEFCFYSTENGGTIIDQFSIKSDSSILEQ